MSVTFDAAAGTYDLVATGAYGFACAGDGFAYSADRRARVELAGASAPCARYAGRTTGFQLRAAEYGAESDELLVVVSYLFFETEFVLAHVDDDDAADAADGARRRRLRAR